MPNDQNRTVAAAVASDPNGLEMGTAPRRTMGVNRAAVNREPLVVYLAHPMSAPTADDIVANLERARRWLRWFVLNTDFAVCAPWIPYVETLDETEHRARGIRDDLAMVARCDAIVLVGGRVSNGMREERDWAHRHELDICSLTELGDEPPDAASTPAALELIAEAIDS